ncbi:MAG: gamma-glutamyl-gamma-aminobutyrate hydrolase family protein [Anaerolineales bacterium]|nr:gamma-glutamyl-gamma-aminobutyrate hydrolase family protein [Anaerolineales bacterium]
MICFVDMEHEKALKSAEKRAIHRAYCGDVKFRLEKISGGVCVVQNYRQITQRRLGELGIKALIISGNTTEWADYDEVDLDRLTGIIRAATFPIFGICGGFQLVAMAHGASIGPMRPLRENEQDLSKDYAAGFLKEWGFGPVRALKADPLFDGMDERPVFLHAHYWEVKEVPPGFELLASSDSCRIQVIKQTVKPVYGVQFHPEAYADGQAGYPAWLLDWVYPRGYGKVQTDGQILLANFFKIAGIFNESDR